MKKPQQSQYTIKQYTTFHYKIGRKNEEKEFLAGLSKSLINSCAFISNTRDTISGRSWLDSPGKRDSLISGQSKMRNTN